MATIPSHLLTFLYFLTPHCLILAEWNTNDYLKKENSLIKPYQDSRWDITGSTIVTNSYVRLTSDHQSRQGAIWNSAPCMLRDWELHVQFKVHGQGTDLFGDGMAIWYTKDRLETGTVFGSKNFFQGLALFLDTYSNHNGPHNHAHPYISAMINNGSLGYDHDRDGTHTELAGCESQFRNKDYETYLAIRYERGTLTMSMDIENKNAWKQCFSVTGIRLPIGYYFGASATTGDLADNHDIISMKLYDIGIVYDEGYSNNLQKHGECSASISRQVATLIGSARYLLLQKDTVDYRKIVPSADFFAPPRDHIEDPQQGGFLLRNMSGWKLLVIIILGIIGLGVCGMVGFIIFTKRQEGQRKRFY